MVRTARLWCRKSLDGHEFDPGLGHPTIGNLLCEPSSKCVPVSIKGSLRQRKEKGGLRLSYALPVAQDTAPMENLYLFLLVV